MGNVLLLYQNFLVEKTWLATKTWSWRIKAILPQPKIWWINPQIPIMIELRNLFNAIKTFKEISQQFILLFLIDRVFWNR